MYCFVSMSTCGRGGVRGKNVGVVVLPCKDLAEARDLPQIRSRLELLKLLPEGELDLQLYPLDEAGYQEQGLVPSRHYTPEEVEQLGFQRSLYLKSRT